MKPRDPLPPSMPLEVKTQSKPSLYVPVPQVYYSKDGSDMPILFEYYCICGEYACIIDKKLELLSRRKTDGAIIISNDCNFKYSLKGEPWVWVKRDEGYEMQKWKMCNNCGIWIGYEAYPKINDINENDANEETNEGNKSSENSKKRKSESKKSKSKKQKKDPFSFLYIFKGALRTRTIG